MASRRKKKKEFDDTRVVRQYTLSGKFVAEYESLFNMSETKSIRSKWRIKQIEKCCMRETASSYESQFRFADDDELYDRATAKAVKPAKTVKPSKSGKSAAENNPVKKAKAEVKSEVAIKTEATSQAVVPQYIPDDIRVKFSPIVPAREFAIIGASNGTYGVVDIENGQTRTHWACTLFDLKMQGHLVGGCYFHTYGLYFDIDDVGSYVVPMEVWREFSFGSVKYEVSNLGRVRISDGEVIAPTGKEKIWEVGNVVLKNEHGDTHEFAIDELVVDAFVNPSDKTAEIVHLDGNRSNCALGNLSYSPDADMFDKMPIGEIDLRDINRGVFRYSLEDGSIACFSCVTEASVQSGVALDVVRKCCDGLTATCEGYVWCYDMYDTLMDLSSGDRVKLFGKYVRQYDLRGDYIRDFAGIESIESVKLSEDDCKMGQTKICGGFIWRFAQDDELAEMSAEAREKLIRGWVESYLEHDTGVPSDEEHVIELCAKEPLQSVANDVEADMSVEVWRPLPMYNSMRRDGTWKYEVSNYGVVRQSCFAGYQNLNQNESHNSGRLSVKVTDKYGSRHVVDVDRMVALAFVYRPIGATVVVHADGNKDNNRADNLVWQVDQNAAADKDWRIRQYDMNGAFVKEYSGFQEAEKVTSCSVDAIRDCCGYHTGFVGGYVWRYTDDDEFVDLGDDKRSMLFSQMMNSNRGVRKYTVDGNLVAEYSNVFDALKSVDKVYGIIGASCDYVPGYDVCYGYRWEWVR